MTVIEKKKIFVIAGEASGDLLGSRMMQSIKNNDYNVKIEFVGVGGEKMEAEGLKSLFQMKEISLMGFFEILPNVFKLFKRIRQTVAEIVRQKPDLILTIDSPGFCFCVMDKLRKKNKKLFKKIKKVHLIAPSVWAYKEKRAKRIAKLYDLLLCVLPFEPPYFEKYGLKTVFIGHPIFDDDKYVVKCNRSEMPKNYNISYEDIMIVLTPGSREGEVNRIYPIMIKSIDILMDKYGYQYKSYHVFTFANNVTRDLVEFIGNEYEFDAHVVSDFDEKQKIMSCANIALAKSGTNTFEFNIYGIPLVITYTFNWFTNKIVKKLVRIKFANLVNILADREIIPEFVLDDAEPSLIAYKMDRLIRDKSVAKKQVEETNEVIRKLGYGSAIKSANTGANEVLKLLNLYNEEYVGDEKSGS